MYLCGRTIHRGDLNRNDRVTNIKISRGPRFAVSNEHRDLAVRGCGGHRHRGYIAWQQTYRDKTAPSDGIKTGVASPLTK